MDSHNYMPPRPGMIPQFTPEDTAHITQNDTGHPESSERRRISPKPAAAGLNAPEMENYGHKSSRNITTVSSTPSPSKGHSRKRLSREFDVDAEGNERYTQDAKRPRRMRETQAAPAIKTLRPSDGDSGTKAAARFEVSGLSSQPLEDDDVQIIGSRIIAPVDTERHSTRFNTKLGLVSSNPSLLEPHLKSERNQTSHAGRHAHHTSFSNARSGDNVQDISSFKDIIGPVAGFREPKPSPTPHNGFSETGVIRETYLPVNSSNPSNMDMVALRLQHGDLNSRNYTWADYGIIERWIAREQAFRLDMLLKQHRRGNPSKTRLFRDRAAQGHLKAMIQWCKKEPQKHVDFYDSQEIIGQLHHFDLTRGLSIFDIVTFAKQVEQCLTEYKQLTLRVPPSHIATNAAQTAQGSYKIPQSKTSRVLLKSLSRSVVISEDAAIPIYQHIPGINHAHKSPAALGGKAQESSSKGRKSVDPSSNPRRPGLFASESGLQRPARGRSFQVLRDETNNSGLTNAQAAPPNALRDRTNLSKLQGRPKMNEDLKKPSTVDKPATVQEENPARKRKSDESYLGRPNQKRQMLTSQQDLFDFRIPLSQIDDMVSALKSHPSHIAASSGPVTAPHITPEADASTVEDSNQHPNVIDGGQEVDLDRYQMQPPVYSVQHEDVQFNQQNLPLELHLGVLTTIFYDPSTLRDEDKRYVPLPPDVNRHALNIWLYGQNQGINLSPETLFRTANMPSEDDFSLLARCVRFARSDAQLEVDWRVHETHVNEIIARTNDYGLELLRSRTDLDPNDYDGTQPSFDILLGIRLAQRFRHLSFVAADIPTMVSWLHANTRFMLTEVVTAQDLQTYAVLFSGYTEYCRRRWPEWKGGIDWNVDDHDFSPELKEAIKQDSREIVAKASMDALLDSAAADSHLVDAAILGERENGGLTQQS